MEEKKINEAQAAEQTTSQDENKNVTELDVIKTELTKAKDEAQRNAERWVNALKDIANYQDAIKKMVEELGWDNETAIGKIGGYLGHSIFDIIETCGSSKFKR